MRLRNFGVLNFSFGCYPEAVWRLDAVETFEEALSLFQKDCDGCCYEVLYLVDEDNGNKVVASAVRLDGKAVITI